MSNKAIIISGISYNYPSKKWVVRKPTKKDLLKYKSYKIYTNKLEQKTKDLPLSGIFEYNNQKYPLYANNDLLVINNQEAFWKWNDFAIVDGEYFTYEIDRHNKRLEIERQPQLRYKNILPYERKIMCKITDIINLLDLGNLYFIYKNKLYRTNRFYIDEHHGVIPQKPNYKPQYIKEFMSLQQKEIEEYSFPKLKTNESLRYILSEYGIKFAATKKELEKQLILEIKDD